MCAVMISRRIPNFIDTAYTTGTTPLAWASNQQHGHQNTQSEVILSK